MTTNSEQNKDIVRQYVSAVNRGDQASILDLLSDDFTFTCLSRRPEWLRLCWDREQFAAAPGMMSSQMKTPIVMKINGMIGERDQVAVEAESYGDMNNGKIYDNAYHFVFRMKDGKIAEVKEYSCSFTANDVFGEYAAAF